MSFYHNADNGGVFAFRIMFGEMYSTKMFLHTRKKLAFSGITGWIEFESAERMPRSSSEHLHTGHVSQCTEHK